MAQLRNMLRAYAWSQQKPPSKIVEWLDEAAQYIAEIPMATLIFARVELPDDGGYLLTWTNAGHPPPLLIDRGGEARFLDSAHGILLSAAPDQPRPDATAELPPGSTLLLYTDGLIESPGSSLDEGLRRLRREAASLVHRPLDPFTDAVLDRARAPGSEDDVALLTIRVPDHEGLAAGPTRRAATGR
ncbi:serine/threonine-protein phosphatase [Streptomyces hainanensis]|uniref:Serine/threonine-protein phosphatase n=1 Tax=Streptomyces hainanensis TaxID=402648 RepID=A0A4R4T9S6_9ACTN|nr:serine/threonine-protein phosphatase [Streptomyces hainanensis]